MIESEVLILNENNVIPLNSNYSANDSELKAVKTVARHFKKVKRQIAIEKQKQVAERRKRERLDRITDNILIATLIIEIIAGMLIMG